MTSTPDASRWKAPQYRSTSGPRLPRASTPSPRPDEAGTLAHGSFGEPSKPTAGHVLPVLLPAVPLDKCILRRETLHGNVAPPDGFGVRKSTGLARHADDLDDRKKKQSSRTQSTAASKRRARMVYGIGNTAGHSSRRAAMGGESKTD